MTSNKTITAAGFQAGAAACGIKEGGKRDIALIVAERPCSVAAVYTRNLVQAAPVLVCKEQFTRNRGKCQAIVVNSGNANACTGRQGLKDARAMVKKTADILTIDPDHVLVCSTGIIGERLPMENVIGGIEDATRNLSSSQAAGLAAAEAITTTDKSSKIAARSFPAEPTPLVIAGMAKGAGMICPNMATMLGFLGAKVSAPPGVLKRVLRQAVDATFNRIFVDGHTSTNDAVILLANAKGPKLSGRMLKDFERGVAEVCGDLAEAIVADGEGATKVTTIEVRGASSAKAADEIARSIAFSALVRTALYGNDPNWGRIVSAVGYCPSTRSIDGMKCRINGTLVYRNGTPARFDAAKLSKSMASPKCHVLVELQEGKGSAWIKASDLTHEYVTINAEYHT